MNKPGYKSLVVLMATVVGLWALSGYVLNSDANRGTFGDMFGAINALFSGLAFAGIIYTILLQRHELELQREELRATRSEMARSASAQEKSERALQLQVEAAEYTQRLTAVNHMLDFANLCYQRLQGRVLNSQESEQCALWADRRSGLIDELDRVYAEVVSRRRSTTPLTQERNPRGFR